MTVALILALTGTTLVGGLISWMMDRSDWTRFSNNVGRNWRILTVFLDCIIICGYVMVKSVLADLNR